MQTWAAINAGFHYIAIMGLAATLSIEVLTLKGTVTAEALTRLTRVDALYGLSALLVLVTGLLRVLVFGKGVDFYLYNWIFHLKVVIFIAVGLWSVLPTLRFMRWRKAYLQAGVLPTAAEFSAMRKVAFAEVHLLAILPFLAALMARGIGFIGS